MKIESFLTVPDAKPKHFPTPPRSATNIEICAKFDKFAFNEIAFRFISRNEVRTHNFYAKKARSPAANGGHKFSHLHAFSQSRIFFFIQCFVSTTCCRCATEEKKTRLPTSSQPQFCISFCINLKFSIFKCAQKKERTIRVNK